VLPVRVRTTRIAQHRGVGQVAAWTRWPQAHVTFRRKEDAMIEVLPQP
jgi:hypothetical protein